LAIYFGSEQNRIPGSPGLPGFDKVAHFGAFGLLATLWIHALDRPGARRRALVLGVLIASLYGALDEYHQSFNPGRSVEFADWVADTLGALTAALAYRFWPRWRGWLQQSILLRRSASGESGSPHP